MITVFAIIGGLTTFVVVITALGILRWHLEQPRPAVPSLARAYALHPMPVTRKERRRAKRLGLRR